MLIASNIPSTLSANSCSSKQIIINPAHLWPLAGGVILVTTKRPKGETSFQLNYNNNFAFATAMNLPEQAPLMEYLQAYSDAAGDQFWTMGSPSVSKWMGYLEQYRNNPSSIPTVGDGIFKDTDGAVYYMNEKDLVKNMLETSFQHTHNISMTGGTDKLRYRLSAGFIDNDGVLITDKDKYRRMNVRWDLDADDRNQGYLLETGGNGCFFVECQRVKDGIKSFHGKSQCCD